MPAVQALLARTRARLLIFAAIAVVRRAAVSSAPATSLHSVSLACDERLVQPGLDSVSPSGSDVTVAECLHTQAARSFAMLPRIESGKSPAVSHIPGARRR
jgi:hypothetical protein